ncbi:ferredoxin [Candidatus Gottesmanbacteria bacterium]|nr:ferredoxin [Candidatus Gottesmanbacteria bacterium]
MDQNNSTSPSGPKKVGKLTITVDRNLCIGAASCVAVAPKTFALDNEAKAIILESAGEEVPETIFDSARACPVLAIILHDENGKQVFP